MAKCCEKWKNDFGDYVVRKVIYDSVYNANYCPECGRPLNKEKPKKAVPEKLFPQITLLIGSDITSPEYNNREYIRLLAKEIDDINFKLQGKG